MSIEYRTNDGRAPVRVRWGGSIRGTVIEVSEPVDPQARLEGEDGSVTTLAELCRTQAGRGKGWAEQTYAVK